MSMKFGASYKKKKAIGVDGESEDDEEDEL